MALSANAAAPASSGPSPSAAARPNLIPQNVALSSYSARPGTQLTVTWTMTNAGSGNCLASFTGLHLGTSPTMPPTSDSLNLLLITPGIAAKTSLQQTNVISLPSTLPLGTYYLWVFADDDSASTLNQTSRADDRAHSAALSITTVVVRPNLIPQNVALSSYSARPGDQLTVTCTITNAANVTCPASVTGLHLGTSLTSPPASDGLNVLIPTPELGANSSVSLTNIVTIPASTPLGTYYLWVVADDVATSTLNQTSRSDDYARSAALSLVTVVTRPNLVPQNVVLSTYSARPGDQVTVMWTMTNSGNGNCAASSTGLHLGTSATAPPTTDGLDLLIPTPAISANSSLRQTNVVTLPANTPLGTYYLWVIADDVTTSTLNQTSRADDAARSAALSLVTVILRPNLVPQNVALSSALARPGDQITVTWTLTNSGNAVCPASVTGLHLGSSATTRPTNDNLNISIQTPQISANSAIRQTNIITIPANSALGTNYLWVVADDVTDSTLNQSSRADDVTRSPALSIVSVLPQPNLIPQNVALSSYSARPGDQITVSWILTNSGSANCPASVTGLRLSSSATTPPTNTGLLASIQTAAINAGSFLRQTNLITIPTNTAVGSYYLWVIADDVANSTLNQTSRADDYAHSSALGLFKTSLVTPLANATVDAPPTFNWSASGPINPVVYLANKSAPVLAVDKFIVFENSSAPTNFTPSTANWLAAVNTLGVAQNYYWTIGSADANRREIYAEWRPFKTAPMTVSGSAQASSTQFSFQIVSPNQAQIIIEGAEAVTNAWTQIGTVQNQTGTATYTDTTAGARSKRFYRPKP